MRLSVLTLAPAVLGALLPQDEADGIGAAFETLAERYVSEAQMPVSVAAHKTDIHDILRQLQHGLQPDVSSAAVLEELVGAVGVMQNRYFETWQGTWPAGIDWTRAVMNTQVTGALRTMSGAREFAGCGVAADHNDTLATENRLAKHFAEITAFYFGENALDLRGQAFDDMQWVILGWLEAIRLIDEHSGRHFPDDTRWFAHTFKRGFAHRARVFWDLAAVGWDDKLCGGGMTWNPRLQPYKNAITNELFVAASVSMYLYFPGDDIDFPFTQGTGGKDYRENNPKKMEHIKAHDNEKYLHMAKRGYDWLYNSGMRNKQGLFTDGFHSSDNVHCDQRAEAVFTYNQGVILTGHRGLWEATGNTTYIKQGHELIRDVIKATGYDKHGNHSSKYSGLGRHGVIEESCDAEGRCSQDGQSFKEYGPWVALNAQAAIRTKNKDGVMGMWWIPEESSRKPDPDHQNHLHERDDYRNNGVPRNEVWMFPEDLARRDTLAERDPPRGTPPQKRVDSQDLNDRGRGRTPESQGSGIAVIKALYELVKLANTIY